MEPTRHSRRLSGRVTTVRVIAVLAVLALLIAGIVVVTLPHQGRATPACRVSTSGQPVTFDLAQTTNATTIAAVGKRIGMPDHAVTVALAAAMQESGLHNLSHGDRDSVGLFQQRPSQGWGSVSQLMTPVYAASAFYKALAKVPGWGEMSVTEAAQRVQRSSAPHAYAQWESDARALAVALTGQVAGGLTCRFDAVATTASASSLSGALASELGSPGPGVDVSAARGWTIAGWLVGHASTYGVTAVSFAGQRWTPASGTWGPAPAAGQQVAYRIATAPA
jgi:hypothetical protein